MRRTVQTVVALVVVARAAALEVAREEEVMAVAQAVAKVVVETAEEEMEVAAKAVEMGEVSTEAALEALVATEAVGMVAEAREPQTRSSPALGP